MFKALRALFGGQAHVGELVTVLSGPYAGKTGTISATDGELSTIFIDECCQPRVTQDAFRREWRGRGIPGAFRKARGKDVNGEIAQMQLGQHENIDPMY
jgi:KOW motif